MGCFLPCFGSCKDAKHRHKVQPREDQRNAGQRPQQSPVFVSVKPIDPVPESRGKEQEDQLSVSTRKRVTFDSNVRTYDHVSLGESQEYLLENEGQQVSVTGKEEEKGEDFVKPSQSHSYSGDTSIASKRSSGNYPPNHRYQNCRESDDEFDYEGIDLNDNDDDNDDDDSDSDNAEDPMSKVVAADENDASWVASRLLPESEVSGNCNVRDRSVYVNSVLNPVENLPQWKAVEAKGTAPLKEKENEKLDKELQLSFSSEPSFKGKTDHVKKSSQEVAVDASLSTWLGSSQSAPANKPGCMVGSGSEGTPPRNTSYGSNSPVNFDDRPILGALTVEELKQISATSSPRKSPGHSPDEMAIIGSVGTYWNHNSSCSSNGSGSVSSYKGVPITTSKYSEDKGVNWHSTPFETRLEKISQWRKSYRPLAPQGSNVC